MSRMEGIPQRAIDGGAVMPKMDGQVVAPCNVCSSIIRGGIAQGAMDADAMIAS
jgi:hypothetical protein